MIAKIAAALGILATLGGGYVYDLEQRSKAHDSIVADSARRSNEAELQRVELEIKFYNEISDRRPLNRDEQERLDYLRQLRGVLVEQLTQK